MEKKEALLLAGLAVGGYALLKIVSPAGEAAGAKGEARYRPIAGGILGSKPDSADAPTAPSIINIPSDSFTGFPAPPTFDVMRFIQPPPEPVPTVSTARGSKKDFYLKSTGESRERTFVSGTTTITTAPPKITTDEFGTKRYSWRAPTVTPTSKPATTPSKKTAKLSKKALSYRRVVGKVHQGYQKSNSGGGE